jgi:hypothetical protein
VRGLAANEQIMILFGDVTQDLKKVKGRQRGIQ